MKKFFFLLLAFALLLQAVPSQANEDAGSQEQAPVYKFGPIPKSHVKLISYYIEKYEEDVISYEVEKKAPVKHVSDRTELFSKTPVYGWASIVKIKKHDYKRKLLGHSLYKDSKGRVKQSEIYSEPIRSGSITQYYRIYVRNYSVVGKELLK